MSGINNETPPNALKPWQARALAKDRTPLPESPGCRPWLETISMSEAETNSNQGYKFWNQDEVKRLIELKREGKSWRDISDHFPGRSIEALKQTYHKRRSTAEEQMRPVAKEKEDQPVE
ncbi:hypothetical protein QWA68_005999 [Fusarium oxysporum]|nr:hypothetical protein QWA68_005999 [Fusarium oxysporum]